MNKNIFKYLKLEKRIAALEAAFNDDKYCYKIHSTMTGDNFYFVSDNPNKLKYLDKDFDLFRKLRYSDEDYSYDDLFDDMLQICNKYGIEYLDDTDEFVDASDFIELRSLSERF